MPPSRSIGAAVWLQAALVLAIGWFYFWTAVPERSPGLVAAQDDGYYNLLTRGFLRGHLYMDVKRDPYLAALANPWDPAQRAGHGMPDTSYFKGRYYIYFGVTPAVLLFLPFRVVTGNFISETLASPIFACLGLAVSVGLLFAVRRRYFPRASEFLVTAGILALGLANMVPVLLRRPGFWEVPITCGYACCMVALAALFQALHSRRSVLWLAVTSAAFGLAVGSRPLYLLTCPVVLLPVWLEARERGPWRKLALAAVGPMAAIGLGLAAYNYLRFGSPTEFGLRYQIWNEDPAKTVRFAWRYLAYNFRAYWLVPAEWGRYFPFVAVARLPAAPPGHYGAEDPYGIIPNMPFALLALGTVALAARGSAKLPGRLRLFGAAVALAAGAMAVVMLFFQAALNRYMVDFAPLVVLLACLGLLTATTRSWYRGPAAALAILAACGLAVYSAGFNLLASQRHNELFRAEHPALYQRVAQRWNRLSWEYDRWRKTPYGPVEMKVIFPAAPSGTMEPLVVTGRTFLSDYLFVQYVGADSVLFGLEHTSRGTLLGEPIRIKPGAAHTVRIDLGSLYPPAAHPYFGAMSPVEARLRQNTLRVTLDGQVAFDRFLTCYDADGPAPTLGSSGDRLGFSRPFSGRILSWRRLPDATIEPPGGRDGPLRLKLTFPPFTGPRTEPLLSTGEAGRGDLIYVRYESADRISFGYAHSGSVECTGPRLVADFSAVQEIAIDSGVLHPAAAHGPAGISGEAVSGHLSIRFNGQTAFATPVQYYACAPDRVAVGFNAIQTAAAADTFTGRILSVQRTPEAREPRSGPFRLELRLPPFSGLRSEPLICAGATGRGDLIYVRYLSSDRVSFGYDHWGVGGSMSPPCPVDPQAVQTIEIDFGALHSPASANSTTDSKGNLSDRLLIRLNGRAALDQPAPYYASDPATIAVGLNPIQMSTASASFTGDLLKAERNPAP